MNLTQSVSQTQDGWANFSEDVSHEQSQMVRRFHIWIADKRQATEKQLMKAQREVRETAPFARAGLDGASTPTTVPLLVIAFASSVLAAMELEAEKKLLDAHYLEAVNNEVGDGLMATPSGTDLLWQQFINEQKAA